MYIFLVYMYLGRDHDDVHVDARRAGASHEALGNQVCVVNSVVSVSTCSQICGKYVTT